MNDIGVGAVGAALIAGLVSILGLVIGKEQKVSEFRQNWIDDLRKCMIAYLVHINSISDILTLKHHGQTVDNAELLQNYRSLNEANHGITLRINPTESPSQALLASMKNFEAVASSNGSLQPAAIKVLEDDFIDTSKELLKYEWEQVKKGEKTYRIAKKLVIAAIVFLAALLAYFWFTHETPKSEKHNGAAAVGSVVSVVYANANQVSCKIANAHPINMNARSNVKKRYTLRKVSTAKLGCSVPPSSTTTNLNRIADTIP